MIEAEMEAQRALTKSRGLGMENFWAQVIQCQKEKPPGAHGFCKATYTRVDGN